MRFTLRQVQVFVAVARAENVSRAAESLALSQSAASAALAELEGHCAQPLFDRHGKRLRLNEQGSLLLPHAVELLDRAAEFEGRMRGEQGLGPLRVGATLTIGNYLLPLIVRISSSPTPRAGCICRCATPRPSPSACCITRSTSAWSRARWWMPSSAPNPGWRTNSWCSARRDMRSRRAGARSVDELAGQPWILRERGSGTRETFDRALRHHPGRGGAAARTRAHRGDQARGGERARAWAACRGSHCATPSAGAAWWPWRCPSSTCVGASASSGIAASITAPRCAASSRIAAPSPPAHAAVTRFRCRRWLDGRHSRLAALLQQREGKRCTASGAGAARREWARNDRSGFGARCRSAARREWARNDRSGFGARCRSAARREWVNE